MLLPAMRKVVAGGMYISPKVAELLAGDISPQSQNLPHTLLTDREFEVFRHIVRGEALTAIADELSLSVKTVSTHKTHILAKMNMSTQVDLVRYAIDQNLIDM
jgi:DNA-binding NarL/FixJ family response regulator